MNFIEQDRKYINSWAITSDYSEFGERGDVVLIYNDKDGKRMQRNIPVGKEGWYFYVKKNGKSLSTLKEIYNVPDNWKMGNEWIRVYFPRLEFKGKDLKSFIYELEKRGVETYEADLGPSKRLCLDYDLRVEDWEEIRVLYFDIETDDSRGEISVGRDRILSFAAVDRNGEEFFITNKDEKILLLEIKKFIEKYDMLVGWNSKDFDLPYLKARFVLHKIQSDYLYNILSEDMMRRVQYFYSKDPEARRSISSYSLDYISNYFLGEKKVERNQKVIDLYNSDPAKFKEYNIQDCRLLKNLEDKLGTIKLTYLMFQWCGCFCQNWSMVKTIDNFILSSANKKGIHYRTNLSQLLESGEEKENEEYLGAFVLKPIPGYYEDVYDLDFKSLYPNIIRTFNISPDSLVKAQEDFIKTPVVENEKGSHGGMKYSREIVGVIPEKIGILLKQREEIRKEMKKLDKYSSGYKNLNVKQLIVKELANSMYGVMGNKWFRSFSIPMAESITATGQYLIQYVKKIMEEEGRTVIYIDTDSIFCTIKPKENIEKILKWINLEIDKHLKKNFKVKTNTIEMALDAKFDKFIIETKKKYVGKIGEHYKFVGMECVKRDTIPIVVNCQKKLIDKIMEGKKVKDISKWIEAIKEGVLTKEIGIEDITIRKKLTKLPTSYKAKTEGRTYTAPLHVRIAAELMKKKSNLDDNKSSLFSPGSIISYIVTRGGDGDKADGVHISEFKGEWDRNYYWQNIIFPPLERMLTVSFPKEDWSIFYIKKIKKSKKEVKKKYTNILL